MDRMHLRWLGAAAAALLVAGCAQSNGDISYVQPNYTRKADLLDGVWYLRNTVTRTPATTGFTYAGQTGELEKIVWEIQETSLIGYRAYPYIPGQDQNVEDSSVPSGTTTRYCKDGVCVGGHKYYGAPIAVFPIVKQFDVQRGYNPASGEETNVINENASDRPWNEREYIRVDWASNGAGWTMGTFGIMNPTHESDLSSLIYEDEPGTDQYDWPRAEFTEVNGEQKMTYFEFTARYMAHPDAYTYQVGPNRRIDVPACWLTPAYDCTAQQIEMRTSIAKVDPNRTQDYEPLLYDNDLMNKFGYFRTERFNYDRRFGINESDKIYLANRHRIWKSSFQKDANGNVDWSKPLPMAQREVQPIVYYLPPANRMGGVEEYQQYLEAARVLEQNWDKAFRRAVAAARGVDVGEVGQVLYICENPVPAGAPAACGPANFEARFGDLRRSFLWTVPEAVPNGLLGYGPSSADPETGEIISANANIYTAAVAYSAQRTLDMVNVLTGDVTIDELIRGKDVRDYMLESPSYASVQGKTGALESELQGEQVQRTGNPTLGEFQRLTPMALGTLTTAKASNALVASTGDRVLAAAEMLRDHPSLESALVDNPELAPDMMTLFPPQVQAEAELNPDVKREVLRQALLRTPELAQANDARLEFASRSNVYLADQFEDRYILALAWREANARTQRITQLTAEGLSPAEARAKADEELRWKFRKHIWRATAEHEIGHTFGLRHNFQGSFDAVNFFDPYWDMKNFDGQGGTLTVKQTDASGATKRVVPRTPADLKAASDGVQQQLLGGMTDYEYSSIMDYGGKSNADWQGVGKYDEAAILFAYSGDTQPGYVEVFSNPLRTDVRQFDASDLTKLPVTGAGYDVPIVNALHTNPAVPNYTERFHYSTAPLHFGTGTDITQVIASGIQNMRARRLEKWSVVKEKEAQLRTLLQNNPVPTQQDVASLNVPAEVPYMFCTDDHVGYVLSCNRFDRGGDYYEMTRTWLEDYWNGYFLNHFRRDRYTFGTNGAVYGTMNTFNNASMVYKQWMYALYGSQGPNAQKVPSYVGGPFGYDPLVQAYWSMATFDGINNLLQVMSVPPAGFYMRRPAQDMDNQPRWDLLTEGFDFDDLSPDGRNLYMQYYSDRYGADAFAQLARGKARKMYSRYDYKSGFGFWNRMSEVGHYNDQIGALFAAVDPRARFQGVDSYADQNRFSIPYYLMFREELNDVFGAFWATGTTGLKTFGEAAVQPTMYLSLASDGTYSKPNLVYPAHVQGSKYIAGFNYPKPITLPTNAQAMVAPANLQTTWTSRIYALYLGMAMFNANFDLDFAKQNMVVRVGGSETVTPPAGYEAYEVEDDLSGGRYVAYQPAGATKDTPAVAMIKFAQDVAAIMRDERYDEATRAQYRESFQDRIRDLDLMRGMYQVYGKAF